MSARKEILERLLALDQPIEQTKADLANFPWDSEELVFLTLNQTANVLRRYLDGTITVTNVEDWASTIECRDDIGFKSPNEVFLRDLVHDLANPLLTWRLSVLRGRQLLKQIEGMSGEEKEAE